jgi:hypothetical protein
MRNLAIYRFTPKLRVWRRELGDWRIESETAPAVAAQAGR